MPRAGQIIPEHLYPHEMVVVNDNTEYDQVLPEPVDDTVHMLFVFSSPKGIDGSIQNITGGVKEFVNLYGQGPFSLYGQPYLNAYNAHRSGYITGHCLRVSAPNAEYATSVLVALYRIDDDGKMIVRFKTRPAKRALLAAEDDEMDYLYDAPDDVISDGSDDDGFTEVKLFSVTALGRGIYGRKLSYGVSNNPGSDKENEYKNYIFHVYENEEYLKEVETFGVCFSETAVVDDEGLFTDGVLSHPTRGSKRIKVRTNLDGFQQIVDAYNDYNEDSTYTIDNFDVLLGIDKDSRDPIVNYEIDTLSEDVISLNATGGIALEGGSDGDLDESGDPVIRQRVLEEAYLKAFDGTTYPLIVSTNRYPCHVILDANFPVDTKIALAALVERRGDCIGLLDCGTEIKTYRSPITYVKNNLDSYVRNRNEAIEAICGKIRDPYSKKPSTVTVTYDMAYRLPMHWAEYGGKHVPFAGNTYGIIDEDFMINSIYPIYDECLHSEIMDELVDERINFARINAKQRIVIGTQHTRQTIWSNLSELNNVCILLDIIRDCRKLCASYQYNFSEPEDIVRFNRDAEVVLSAYEDSQIRSITARFDKNDWEATRGILHLYVEMIHKDLVKTTIIEIDVNRGSVGSSE